jgi:hemoglobin
VQDVRVEPTLYDALGGRDVLKRAVDDLYDRLLTDPAISPAFAYVEMSRLRAHMREFLAVALGADVTYAGRDLRDAHARVHITDEMFDRTVSHLVDTLAGLQVDPEVIDEVVIRLAAQRSQVVTRLPVGGGELPTA